MSSSAAAGAGAPSASKPARPVAYPLKDPGRVVPLETFVAESRRLLDLERSAEVEERTACLRDTPDTDLEARGLTLLTLAVLEASSGLFGRSVISLGDPASRLLPSHRFSVGDIVGIRAANSSKASVAHDVTGIVSKVTEFQIAVTVDEAKGDAAGAEDAVDGLPDRVRLDLLANDVTYRRLSDVLAAMGSYNYGGAARLVGIMFGEETPRSSPPSPVVPFRQGLNRPQLAAIEMALASADVSLIHGPPGTGKTTTVVELIRHAVARGDRVLAVAPSNVAVDNIVERLAVKLPGSALNVIRVGHPARMAPAVLQHCLDARIKEAEGTAIVEDVRVELGALQKERSKTRDKPRRREIQVEERKLRKEIREREEKVVAGLLKSANVVCTTNVGAASKVLQRLFGGGGKRKGGEEAPPLFFDLVVIDEAAQAVEVSCWIPLLMGKRCVLAGDHLQLPPTVTSKDAEAQGLNVTLVDRIATRFKAREDIVSMLTIQYRMHSEIMGWSSNELYESRLTADPDVAGHVLTDLKQWKAFSGDAAVGLSNDAEAITSPMLLIDTAGCGIEELQEISTESKANPGEAAIVKIHVLTLLRSGLRPQDIAVITPYNAQVGLLRSMMLDECPGVEVRSVDGFQGQEREAVVLSFVRSNLSREVGFLSDRRRINVAVTRAKRHVAIVCDSDTVSSDPFLNRLIKYIHEHGVVRSAAEFEDVARFGGGGSSDRTDEVTSRFMASSASGSAAGRPTAASTALKPDPRRKELLALFNRQVEVLVATAMTLNGVGKRGKASGITFPFQALPDAGLPMDMLSRVGRVCRGHDDSLRLEFPPSLNSFDRMLVHEVCTSKDVTHESSGDGSDRRIVVCAALVAAPPAKQPEPPVERITAHTTLFQALGAEAELSADADQGVEGGSDGIHLDASVVLEGSAGDVPIPGDDADDEVASDACEPIAAPSSVPDGATPAVAAVAAVPLEGKNLLAALAAERAARAKPVVKPPPVPAPPQGTSLSALGLAGSGKVGKAGGAGGKSGKGPKPAATGPVDKSKYLGVACTGVKDLPSALVKGIEGEGGKGKKKKDGAKEEEVDPDMALLDAVIADARVCGARGCKKSVLTLSSLCPHCRLRFCFTHGQAEAHGCGDEARAAARESWMAAHVGGGGDKPSALPAWKRNSLETTLHKRIEEVASGRKPQKKEGGEEGKAATAAGGKGKKKK